jgi:peroxiredoxin
MQKLIIVLLAGCFITACNNKPKEKYFEVSGSVENSNAKLIYLEKVSAAYMKPVLEDSAELGKDGKFKLYAKADESVVFNLRLDHNQYPVASVINDTDKVKLSIRMSKENPQFPEEYKVEGSPASIEMKDFMYAFGNNLKDIFTVTRQLDSLQKTGAADSVVFPLMTRHSEIAAATKTLTLTSIDKAKDPALALFEIGYYQSTANGSGFGLDPLPNDELNQVIADAAKRFPGHQAIADIKTGLAKEEERLKAASLIGKDAPDFSLPDVNGAEVKLSSFKGKYVLVDFWASWCGPCREENPNVVKAFNKYKGKNFTILGVSLDRPGQKDKWLEAIREDKLAWTQVSDLQYWSTPMVDLYHLSEIPYHVLVDPQGKIVAERLRGGALDAKLAELLR